MQQGLTCLSCLSQLPRLEQLRICQPSFEMPSLEPIACLTSLKRCASYATTAAACPPSAAACSCRSEGPMQTVLLPSQDLLQAACSKQQVNYGLDVACLHIL